MRARYRGAFAMGVLAGWIGAWFALLAAVGIMRFVSPSQPEIAPFVATCDPDSSTLLR